jgi:hypothetical protein
MRWDLSESGGASVTPMSVTCIFEPYTVYSNNVIQSVNRVFSPKKKKKEKKKKKKKK